MIPSIVLSLANNKWEIHLNYCTREIVLLRVSLPYVTGTKPLVSREHQVEVKLLLYVLGQSLLWISVVSARAREHDNNYICFCD